MSANDRTSYAVASSLTEFLIERGGTEKLLRFAEEVSAAGLQRALVTHYRLRDLEQLSDEWRKWESARATIAQRRESNTR